MPQLVRLVYTHPVYHFTAVLGHDVEQVVDDLGVGAVGLDLQLIGRRHVDRYGPDLLGNSCWQLFEEGSGRLARAAITDP
ncbi:hypothetical protein F783_015350 [Bordetella holmesii F627]|nr:hypothetical protein F783_001420 [Bordetella holmesii F627]AMD50687.1 hypothetical protein F783_015350 [Bordetella holmesii F627]